MWKYNKPVCRDEHGTGRLTSRQTGFTLVELAIVLVIIGLILAAVLKGQEMIQNAKVKNVISDLRGVSAAYYSYQDRYKAIPGDDGAATAHLGQTALAGNGNGIIEGAYTDANLPSGTTTGGTLTTEAQAFWQHTRMAGFLTGATAPGPTFPALNSLGGLLGVQSGITTNVYGMTGNVVCSGSIPWKIAQAVDIMIDDGNSDTGNVRAGAASATPNFATATTVSLVYGTSTGVTPPTSVDELHTLCMKI